MSEDPDSRAYRTVLFTTMLNRMPPERRREYMAFHGFGFLSKPMNPIPTRPPDDSGINFTRLPVSREAK